MKAITISKIYEKCEQCKYKDNCNDKRIVACAEIQYKDHKHEASSQPMKEEFNLATMKVDRLTSFNILNQIQMGINLKVINDGEYPCVAVKEVIDSQKQRGD